MKTKRQHTVEFNAIHGYVIAEAIAHALNSGHFAKLANPAPGRHSIFAFETLGAQVLDILEQADVIKRTDKTTVTA